MSYNEECPCCLEKFSETTKFTKSLTKEQLSCMYVSANDISNWTYSSGNDVYSLEVYPEKIYAKNSSLRNIPSTSVQFKGTKQLKSLFGESVISILKDCKNREVVLPVRVGKCNHAVCRDCEEKLRTNVCPMCRENNYLQPFSSNFVTRVNNYYSEINTEGEHFSNYNTDYHNTDYEQSVQTYTFQQLLDSNQFSDNSITITSSSVQTDVYNFGLSNMNTYDEDEDEDDEEDDDENYISPQERYEREYAGDYGEIYNQSEMEDD